MKLLLYFRNLPNFNSYSFENTFLVLVSIRVDVDLPLDITDKLRINSAN
jgi:hypothetical protein